jgi:16S rRNA (guanine527-N7)-methyltransferase
VEDSELVAAIADRAHAAGLSVGAAVVRGCAEYLSLLARWNQRMNLTALPLNRPFPAGSIDKLLIEPLVAAALFRHDDRVWIDLGSGGGSPAIPLRLAHAAGSLEMVESRSRKCAFLREAARTLELRDTHIRESRYETLARQHDVDLITVRAVRVDDALLNLLTRLLRPRGRVMAFGGWQGTSTGFSQRAEYALPDGSTLQILERR